MRILTRRNIFGVIAKLLLIQYTVIGKNEKLQQPLNRGLWNFMLFVPYMTSHFSYEYGNSHLHKNEKNENSLDLPRKCMKWTETWKSSSLA